MCFVVGSAAWRIYKAQDAAYPSTMSASRSREVTVEVHTLPLVPILIINPHTWPSHAQLSTSNITGTVYYSIQKVGIWLCRSHQVLLW